MQKLTPEQISACVDGEATSQEMDALVHDSEAHQTWSRYHLIRDALQQELPNDLDFSLADRVAAEIDNEPTVLAPRSNASKKNVWQSAVGLAVAASVFAVVVGVWRPQNSDVAGPELAATPALSATPIASEFVVTETSDEQQERLEQLLINHTEAAAASGLGAMLPYARVVSDRIEVPVSEPLPIAEESATQKAKNSNSGDQH